MSYKLGDKEYSDEELSQALKATAELNELRTNVKPVLDAAQRYKLSPKELVENASGAFGQLIRLQEMGILDENMQVKRSDESVKADLPSDSRDNSPPPSPPPSPSGGHNVEEIVSRALKPFADKFTALEQRMSQINDGQGRLLRERLMERVNKKHPELTEKDVSLLVARASSNKEDFWELADQEAKAKGEERKAIENDFAKRYNLDLAHLNKLQELKSDEGRIAEVVIEGKKVSSKGGENAVTPKEAMMSYMEAADKIGDS